MPKNKIIVVGKDLPKNEQSFKYFWTDSRTKKRCQLTSFKGENKTTFSNRCGDAESSNKSSIDMTVAELHKEWRNNHLLKTCGKSDIEQMDWTWDNYIEKPLGHVKLSDVKRSMISNLLNDAAKTPKKAPKNASKVRKQKVKDNPEYLTENSLKHIRKCLTRIFNYGIYEMELPISNPALHIKLNPVVVVKDADETSIDDSMDLNKHFVGKEILDRFFKVDQDCHFRYLIELILYTGLRPSEVLALKWGNIKGTIKIRRGITKHGDSLLKTKAAKRDIPLSEPAIDCLYDQYLMLKEMGLGTSSRDYVFPLADGGKPTMSALVSAFNRVIKQTAVWEKIGRKYHGKLLIASVKFVLYDLRHTFATIAAHIMDVKKLQYIMGHANVKTTLQLYAEVYDKQMDEAAYDIGDMYSNNKNKIIPFPESKKEIAQ